MAQIGKSFRNEVNPRHFIFRTREFEQMEIEYFVRPEEAEKWHEYWMQERLRWYVDLGLRPEYLRLTAHPQEDLAHYAAACSDVEYLFPMGWLELEGIANRRDFDLQAHSKESGVTLSYFDEEKGEHVVPYIIEPSAGVDRPLLAFIVDAYREEEVRGEKRVLLKLDPRLAPIKVAVLPLSRNEKLVPTAREVWSMLRPHFMTSYDDAQSIGRALPPAGRGGDAAVRDGRLRFAGGPGSDYPGAGLDGAGAGAAGGAGGGATGAASPVSRWPPAPIRCRV